jgi:hypothetical protein
MIRTQIQLPESVHKALKRWAAKRGISLAEAIRRCVIEVLSEDDVAPGRDSLLRDAMTVIGKYRDKAPSTRVGRDHDKFLPEAFRE